MTAPFDIFLSHNSSDKPAVREIGRKLQAARFHPWLDEWALVPGEVIQEKLADALRACPTCAVFIGPHGIGDWAREEFHVVQNRAAKDRNFRLIPILLPGVPVPFDISAILPFAATRLWVDFRQGLDDPRPLEILTRAIQGLPPESDQPTPAASDVRPYRGLETFDEDHTEFFFGREPDIQRVLEKLKATRFLAVLGPSGSGKSSLVRAGVIPRLRQSGGETTAIQVLRPRAAPITELAAKLATMNPAATMKSLCDDLLADPQTLHREATLALTLQPQLTRIVWVVDQFEEVFTLCTGEKERAAFLANLLFASSIPDGPCIALLTMRADFYGKCAAYPELAARIAAQQFLVSPMDAEMLRQVIEEPARRVGLQLQPGLAETILEDVENQPGALPLLQHALLELWERRTGGTLTLDGYQQSGGVEGSIARSAQTIYDAFTPDQQRTARRILLRLIQPGEGTEDTRRSAGLSELITRAEEKPLVESVVEAFAKARLLTAG